VTGYVGKFGRLIVSIVFCWAPKTGDKAQRAHDALVKAAEGKRP
jgi:hypothetical protein